MDVDVVRIIVFQIIVNVLKWVWLVENTVNVQTAKIVQKTLKESNKKKRKITLNDHINNLLLIYSYDDWIFKLEIIL